MEKNLQRDQYSGITHITTAAGGHPERRSGEDWKLVELFETGSAELYNLASDQGEHENLASKYPDRRDELLEELKKLQKETGALFPRPNNNQRETNK
ncbi:MAG: hypothetical protein R2744_05040 [Bacteroidales bacterium]